MTIVEATKLRIEELCNERGLNFCRLATISGVPYTTVKSIVYNQSKNPSITTIKKMEKINNFISLAKDFVILTLTGFSVSLFSFFSLGTIFFTRYAFLLIIITPILYSYQLKKKKKELTRS